MEEIVNHLGLDDQDTKQNKPEASTKKGNTSKGSPKMKEISPIARRTRSSKRKLEFQQEEEMKLILNHLPLNRNLQVLRGYI